MVIPPHLREAHPTAHPSSSVLQPTAWRSLAAPSGQRVSWGAENGREENEIRKITKPRTALHSNRPTRFTGFTHERLAALERSAFKHNIRRHSFFRVPVPSPRLGKTVPKWPYVNTNITVTSVFPYSRTLYKVWTSRARLHTLQIRHFISMDFHGDRSINKMTITQQKNKKNKKKRVNLG